ncbi:MCE family protein [Rhodococcus rhodnii]|uniref:MCE family protein n=2 Tax=Rhodococcus rhodnii TaxID=38312 RepID=A0A6P2CGN9_9NOCA|nr:MlaD family protein [Rhodococcus rhodnii]EOM76492.1 putative Mce family protein Mce4F [Rhodococcus rhodnii LMG 5362]TXG91919.1 MCE family protein [Rhodococcus rhodnii]
MRSRLVRIQLIAFVVVAVLGVVYVGAKYVRLDKLVGFGMYTVRVEMPDTGGVFTNAEVTYRGVSVGRVGALELTSTGVAVNLEIDTGGPDIPASSKAVVANRSAIGEQYVDLQPDTDQGPYLEEGSIITDSERPVPIETVLLNIDGFVKSVPLDDFTTVVHELGVALDGRGDDIGQLADSLSTLTETAVENLPQTLALIRDSRTVLETQSEQSSTIRSFSRSLDEVTATLRSSDGDLRAVIDNGVPASDEVGTFVNQAGPGLTVGLQNLATFGEKLAPQAVALRPLLLFLPGVSAAASTIAPGDGTVHQGIVLETNRPPSCTLGYEGTHAILDRMRAENPNFDDTQQDFPFNSAASCEVPQGSVTGVRSANRIVYADPNTPQPWDSTPKQDSDRLDLNPIASQLAPLVGVTPR